MKSSYRVPGVSSRLHRDVGRLSVLAAVPPSAVDLKVTRAKAQYGRGRGIIKYTKDNQPRDSSGKFRQILARLKSNLGDKELQNIVAEIKQAEKADDVGDYASSSKAGRNVIKMIDNIESGALDAGVTKNLRQGAADLGRVLAYLPLPQGDPNAKVRFSDLPPSTGRLITGMIDRVLEEVEDKDAAAKIVKVLKSFMSGVRSMSSDELSAELNKLLSALT